MRYGTVSKEMRDGRVRDGWVEEWLGEQKRAIMPAVDRSEAAAICPDLVYHDPDSRSWSEYLGVRIPWGPHTVIACDLSTRHSSPAQSSL